MNKEVVRKAILGQNISEREYNEFLVDYVKETINKDLSLEDMNIIKTLISQGVFNISFALEKAAFILKLQITRLIDLSNNNVIKVFIDDL